MHVRDVPAFLLLPTPSFALVSARDLSAVYSLIGLKHEYSRDERILWKRTVQELLTRQACVYMILSRIALVSRQHGPAAESNIHVKLQSMIHTHYGTTTIHCR